MRPKAAGRNHSDQKRRTAVLSKRDYSPGSMCIIAYAGLPVCLSLASSARGPFVRMTTPGKCLERERQGRGAAGGGAYTSTCSMPLLSEGHLGNQTSSLLTQQKLQCASTPLAKFTFSQPQPNQLSHSSKGRQVEYSSCGLS